MERTDERLAGHTSSTLGRQRGFVALLAAAAVVLWLGRGVLGPFVIAAVLAYAFSPVVWAVQQRTHWPRVAIVAVGYLIAVAIIGLLGYFLAGQVARELQALNAAGPDLVATAIRQLTGSDSIAVGNQQVSVADVAAEVRSAFGGVVASPGEAIRLAGVIGETALQAILVLIVAFYFLVDGRRFRDWTVGLLPPEHRKRTLGLLDGIHEVLGKWLRGQLLLVALVAGAAYLFLGPVLHVPYALAIGVLTGVLEVIPLVGPLIATAIAGTAAYVHGGAGLALVVIGAYFVLRQVEDQVVMPVVIGRAVHLHPVVTIFAVLVGLSSWGILGGLLGVPVAAAVNVIFRDLYASRSDEPETRPAVALESAGEPAGEPATTDVATS